jgi:hypothetical protein
VYHFVKLRVLLPGCGAADGKDFSDLRVEKAFAQYALADHARRAALRHSASDLSIQAVRAFVTIRNVVFVSLKWRFCIIESSQRFPFAFRLIH